MKPIEPSGCRWQVLPIRAHTCANFSRTVRTALLRLSINVPLRGRWCALLTPREALSICASESASRGADVGAQPAERLASPHDDDNVRVVALTG